jgi:hypothetical protein
MRPAWTRGPPVRLRSARDVLSLVYELKEEGASLKVLEPEIESGDGPDGPDRGRHGRGDGAWLYP